MRAAILILAMSFPAVASAQDTAFAAIEEAPSVQAPPAGAARPSTERKRRGSMVGYITDATIESQVRIRFDAGFNNDVPDRAEFFYAQCGCNGPGAPGPGAPGAGDLATNLKFQQLTIDAQYAASGRVAVFASIPARFVQPQTFLGQTFKPPLRNTFVNASGLGDIHMGVKAAIVATDDATLTAQVQGDSKTGNAKEGLGTDHWSIETALLFNQRLSDRLAIESQFGDWHPIGGSTAKGVSYAGDVLFYGIGPSFQLVDTGHLAFAPVVELVGWHVLGGLQQAAGTLGPADGTNIVNLKFGARTTFDNRSSFYVGYGHALTAAVWYSDIVRLEYRYSF
jgi:hypothetical protein